MNVKDLEGKDLTVKDLEVAFGSAWFGASHPKTIEAERETFYGVLGVLPWATTQKSPYRFAGAYVIENPSIPAGEIFFNVPDHPENSVKVINFKVSYRKNSHFLPISEEELDDHICYLSQDVWSALWNSMKPADRVMDCTMSDRCAVTFKTLHGRRISFVVVQPEEEARMREDEKVTA